MFTLRMPARARGDRAGVGPKANPAIPHEARNARLLEGALLDLCAAILIVVPLALFLRSLWS
jgi:hypothetical protein